MSRYGPDDNTFAFELASAGPAWTRDTSQTLRSRSSSISEPEPIPLPWRSRLPASRVLRKLFYIVPIALSLGPVVVLAVLSPSLSKRLDANACLPSGDFVLPGTSSVWSLKNLFTITLNFKGPTPLSCSYGNGDIPTLACVGYTFTQAKVIDVAWDVLVGRGGQLILITVCYRVFREVLKSLMESGEVGYDMFAAVSFHSGGFHSLGTFLAHAVGQTPVPRTRKAVVMYWMMLLASIYVVASETLVSAMTGYTSFYALSLDYNSDFSKTEKGLVDCDDKFIPVWGRVGDSPALQLQRRYGFNSQAIGYEEDPTSPYVLESGWIDYYDRYYDLIYKSCPEHVNISSCPSTHVKTVLHTTGDGLPTRYYTNAPPPPVDGVQTIPSPAPGIVPFPNDTYLDGIVRYQYYACGWDVVAVANMTNIPGYTGGQVVTGICRSGSGYAWGFSFLLLFVVCILNFFFVFIMYALWFMSRQHRPGEDGGSDEFKDAVIMVTAAQRQYGDEINHWNAASLREGVVKGYLGMGAVEDGGSAEVVKRRKRRETVGGVAVVRD